MGLIIGILDWRETDAVGPIKDQGSCGSCYAFSAVACLEAGHYFMTDEYVALSE